MRIKFIKSITFINTYLLLRWSTLLLGKDTENCN